MVRKAELSHVKNNGPLNPYVPYVISWYLQKHRTSTESLEKATVFPKTQSLLVELVPLEAKIKLHAAQLYQCKQE